MERKERRDSSKLRKLMQEYGVKTMEDVQNFVKMLMVESIYIRHFSYHRYFTRLEA